MDSAKNLIKEISVTCRGSELFLICKLVLFILNQKEDILPGFVKSMYIIMCKRAKKKYLKKIDLKKNIMFKIFLLISCIDSKFKTLRLLYTTE